jgi:cyclopropane-fatty-acyl-phospholipid synthase
VLDELAGGRLAKLPIRLRFWDGTVLDPTPGHSGQAGTPPPVVVVGDRRAVSHVLHTPSQLGLARAWVDGSLWVEGDLERVLDTRALLNGVHLSPADRIRLALAAARLTGPGVLKRPPIPAIEASLNGERHSVARDREAVRHHYDVSNDFYRLILGPTMVYSCAYFADSADTLEEAQTRKLDLICRKLQLAEGERLLDIGCGWGSLILHAVANYNVHAVGVTLSEPGPVSRGSTTGSRYASPTTASCPTGRFTRSPRSACTSTWVAASSTNTSARRDGCCDRVGCSSTTGSSGSTPSRRPRTPSSRATSSPTASCTPSPR